MSAWEETLEHEAGTVRVKVQAAVEDAARDALYLSQTPTVREFVRHRGGTGPVNWRTLVEEDFRALLHGKPSYFQVRLIGVADSGREIVRLDNLGGRIETVPPESLQQKGDRDYFRQSVKAAPGEVYLSDINLNQEFGKVSEPHTPTLRAATQVMTDAGELFGIVIINVDVGPLLRGVEEGVAPGVRLYLANAAQDYIIHPDWDRKFGADLGFFAKFFDENIDTLEERRDETLSRESAFRLRADQQGKLHVRVAVPEATLLGGLGRLRRDVIAGTALAALAAAGLIALGARPFARRLRDLTDAVARYEAGQDFAAFPKSGADELGVLAGKFREMSAKVREDVEKLDAARREAEEATRAKDDFLAVMSHEIRTPMNAVIGLLRVLERNRPSPHQEPILASLRSAARQLMTLLNEALDYSKIKAGGIEFERRVFSLRELLADLVLTHRPLALQKGLEFEFIEGTHVPDWVYGDPIRLAQILNNLLGNAIKFTDAGFVRLEADGGGGTARFVVSDSGIGIADGDIGRIFSPFDQAHGDIGRRFGGTGLGLSIARSLVELQGGRLEAESRPGTGSRFTVTLPLDPAPALEVEVSAPIEAPDFSGRRILYVEDIASNREVLAATLDETGAVIEFAETGAEALEKIRAGRFDVILLDLQLPDTNGLALARNVLRERPASRIVAVTAQVAAETRDECCAAGMSGVVAKPFTPEVLFREVAHCLPDGPGAAPLKTDRLHATFAGDSARLQRVVEALAGEFEQYEDEVAGAVARGDGPALRRLRHKMHSALVQLELDGLRAALDALIEAPGEPGRGESVLRHLREARRALEAQAVS